MGAFSPVAMNASGNVVGWDAAYRPFFWSAPVLTDLFPVVGNAVLTGINNSGQIVGNNGSSYFVYSSNSVTDIGVSTWGFNNPGINNYGHVVGSDASGQPFLYRDGTVSTLPLPGCDWGTAEGVNDSDVVIGNVVGGSCGHQSAVVWVNGVPQILPTLDGSPQQVSSMGLNAGGQIVGEVFPFEPIAALWQPDGQGHYTLRVLGPANAVRSYAQGVNDAGVVVGEMVTADGSRAYIWDSSNGIRDLNTLVPSGTETLGWAGKINNAGMIIAYSYSSGHAYLLTPLTPSAQTFTDGFEGASLDPFWTPAWQGYSGGWTLSSEQAHSGSQSLKITSQQFLSHDFGSPQTGSISVWVYSAIGTTGASGALEAYFGNASDWSNSATLAFGGAPGYAQGIGCGGAYIDGVYFGGNGPNGPACIYPLYPPQDGQWHLFEITVNSSGLKMSVDGIVYLTNPTPQSFSFLDIGLWGYPNGVGYFDDFSATFTPYGGGADTTPPSISCASPDGSWHNTNVTFACTATDAGSGLANPADASFTLTTDVPTGTETANAVTGSRTVCDNVGNCATAGPIAGNQIDLRAPTIAITAPTGSTFALGQLLVSGYSCTDGGSGVATCTGPVVSGEPIDTTTVGTHTFTVAATDTADNTTTSSVTYEVTTSAAAQTFTPTGSMNIARTSHQATLLQDGRVLVTGGTNYTASLREAEIFNPATGTWTLTGSTVTPRQEHAATRLSDGRVLLVGGVGDYYSCSSDASAETYDPASGSWTATAPLPITVGTGTIAVTLADGRVLVAGGGNRCGSVFGTAALYDPTTGAWSQTASMSIPREFHSAELLADGRVLVAGGAGSSPFPFLASAEVFDATTESWSAAGAMGTARGTGGGGYVQTFLARAASGNVIAAGAVSGAAGAGVVNATADVFDPTASAWSPTASMSTARYGTTLTTLNSGQILIAGGLGGAPSSDTLASAEVFDPLSGTWTATGSLSSPRSRHTATRLLDGRVLIAGGLYTDYLATAELYTPRSTADLSAPSVSCGSPDGLWHGSNVGVICSASDVDTGLADPADASFVLTTGVPAGVEDANASTESRTVCDKANNCTTVGPISGNKIDRRAPTIAISAPAATAFLVGQVVPSSYGCVDGGSGASTCSGPVASGAPIDTSTVGPHTFSVTATDAVGNATTASVNYVVTSAPLVISVTLSPSTVQGGAVDATATVTLNAPASGTVTQRRVALTSDNPAAATVPAQVTVPLGATVATVTVTSQTVSAPATAHVSATLNGGSATSDPLTVVPLPTVASLVLSPNPVVGGAQDSTAMVTLNAPAVGTAAQRRVTLSSDNLSAATVPASVTVAPGATSATFTVASQAVTVAATAHITGTLNGDAASSELTVLPLPKVSNLSLAPDTIIGGAEDATATITLDIPAVGTAAQRRLTLASDNPAAATVPASVTVPPGATSATFTVTSQAIMVAATAHITGTLNGGAASAELTVLPLPRASDMSLAPATVVGGAEDSTATIVLNAPAVGTAAQRRVTLTSDNPAAATVPTSVTVAVGATSAVFTLTSRSVSAAATANVSAILNGGTASAALTIVPLPTVTALSLDTTTVVGGSADATATVTLSAPAIGTATQRRVSISSGNTAVATVPASVVVPIGATSATFTVSSKVVAASATAIIAAALNGGAAQAMLTVGPLLVSDLSVDPGSVQGGTGNATVTVTLNVPTAGTAAQRRVALSSSDPAVASLPATVVVPIGATSVAFTVTSHVVGATSTVTIEATLNGAAKTATLVGTAVRRLRSSWRGSCRRGGGWNGKG